MARFYRASALCDESLHEKHVLDIDEVQDVLEEFMWPSDLSGVPHPSVDIAALTTRATQDAFLKSLALVALVDGALKDSESELIHRYGRELGRSAGEVSAVLKDVAQSMLSAFSGVTVFREQAEQIGQALGLADADIAGVLDDASAQSSG